MDSEVKLKKDRGCVRCEWIFSCKGKPPGVKDCLNFHERRRLKEAEDAERI